VTTRQIARSGALRRAPIGRSGAIDEGDLGIKPIAIDSAAREELIDLWRWERALSLM
jgi:hypothetical protein